MKLFIACALAACVAMVTCDVKAGEKQEYGYEHSYGHENNAAYGANKEYDQVKKYGAVDKSYEHHDDKSYGHDDKSYGHDDKSYGHDDKSYGHDDKSYGHEVEYRHGVAYNQQYTYHGKYKGQCDKDGFYYKDFSSFVMCSNNNAYVQPCAPGSRNSAYDNYNYGINYYYRDFCDVNLVDYGYGAKGYEPVGKPYGHDAGYYGDGYKSGYHGPSYRYGGAYDYRGYGYGGYPYPGGARKAGFY